MKISNEEIFEKYRFLPSSSSRALVILLAISDDNGIVKKLTGKGYSLNEFCNILMLNWRTTKVSLLKLESDKFIELLDNGIIKITSINKETENAAH